MKITVCLLILVCIAQGFQKEEREEFKRTLRFPEKRERLTLLVDLTHGSISVTGYDGDSVQLSGVRMTRARTEESFRESKEDVLLVLNERRNKVEIIVDAPWRNRWGGVNDYGDRYYGYEVVFDIDVKVPRNVDVLLRTMNKGDIDVRNVSGEFEVKNVNGDIELSAVEGSGKVSTVNGNVVVEFLKNPVGDCSFRTVNGKIQVRLRDPLSADLAFKTFNGKAYTEFDVTSLPHEPLQREERKGKKVYRRSTWYSVRAGSGGPSLSFDSLNGNVHVLKHR